MGTRKKGSHIPKKSVKKNLGTVKTLRNMATKSELRIAPSIGE